MPKGASEHLHQVHVVSWFRKSFPDVLIFAVPNGGKRGKVEAVKLKAEGVLAGVPDLCVPAWRLFIEMKKPGGRLNDAQRELIPKIEASGLTVIVAKGRDEAIEKIEAFVDANALGVPVES